MKRLIKRITRRRRFARAMARLDAFLRTLPENRWDMSPAEDREYARLHDAAVRYGRRLHSLGDRWGYMPPPRPSFPSFHCRSR